MKKGFFLVLCLGIILSLVAVPAHTQEILVTHHGYYKTFVVTAVNENTITLETNYRGKDIVVNIDRDRNPQLKVGDLVRYDNVRNRLRSKVGHRDGKGKRRGYY